MLGVGAYDVMAVAMMMHRVLAGCLHGIDVSICMYAIINKDDRQNFGMLKEDVQLVMVAKVLVHQRFEYTLLFSRCMGIMRRIRISRRVVGRRMAVMMIRRCRVVAHVLTKGRVLRGSADR